MMIDPIWSISVREFLACARRYNLPLGDFPNVDQYRKMLMEVSTALSHIHNECFVCAYCMSRYGLYCDTVGEGYLGFQEIG